MGIDIRLPVGVLFSLLGIILVAYGLLGDPARYQQSLGININLYWGIALLVFGLSMFALGRRGAKVASRQKVATQRPGPAVRS